MPGAVPHRNEAQRSKAGSASAPKERSFHIRFLGPLALAYLLVGGGLRIALWTAFGTDSGVSLDDLGLALASGVANDVVALVYLLLPLTALLFVMPAGLAGSRAGRSILGLALYVCVTGAFLVAVCEFLFFEEYQSRFNLFAVDYLIYPTEVLGNIEESYPVRPLVLACVLAGLLSWLALWSRSRKALNDYPGWRTRLGALVANALAVAVVALVLSSYSLSLDSRRAANEMSMNGVSTFFRALQTRDIDYHQFYPTLPSDEAFARMREYLGRMGGRLASSDPRSLVRSFDANSAGLGRMNVVVLGEESFGAQYVGAYGDDQGLTPVFDALATEGLLFRNAFATGTRTARGLEAMTASFPPIPSEAIVTRPGSEAISNWGDVMRLNGYRRLFLYGGYGAFDNMNHYFASNGFEVSDRLDIKNPKFTNIWGVSDEDLFRHAIGYFDRVAAAGAPFFAIVLSTSNHKPFTFPPGVPGVPEEGGGREDGIRYADYSIGRFFAEARTRPWFANTLFVVIADHDSRVYGRAEIPVENYRIPALLYAPGRLPAGVTEKTFSNLDLAPTVLGLLGFSYSAPFYGVNVLDPAVPDQRPVLFSHNHDVAIYEDGRLSVVGLQKQAQSFAYADGETTKVADDEPMLELLTAYLQTAYELFEAHRF